MWMGRAGACTVMFWAMGVFVWGDRAATPCTVVSVCNLGRAPGASKLELDA